MRTHTNVHTYTHAQTQIHTYTRGHTYPCTRIYTTHAFTHWLRGHELLQGGVTCEFYHSSVNSNLFVWVVEVQEAWQEMVNHRSHSQSYPGYILEGGIVAWDIMKTIPCHPICYWRVMIHWILAPIIVKGMKMAGYRSQGKPWALLL